MAPSENEKRPKAKRDHLLEDHALQQKGIPLLSSLRGAALLAAGILALSATALLIPPPKEMPQALEKMAEAAYPPTHPVSKLLTNTQLCLEDLLPLRTQLDQKMEKIQDTPQNYTLRENKKWREQNPEAAAEMDAGLFKTLLQTHQALEENPELARQNAEKDLKERREEINNEVLGIDIYHFQERENERRNAAQTLVQQSLPPNSTHLPHQIERLTRAVLALQRATEIVRTENPTPELKKQLYTLTHDIDTLFQRSQAPKLQNLVELTQKTLETSEQPNPKNTDLTNSQISKKKTPRAEPAPQL